MGRQIAIVAPYLALKREALDVVNELGLDILVEEGDLSEGVEIAHKAVAAGAEVIISRGGTALLIDKTLDIPVVEIEVSPYDILRCLLKLRDYRDLIGITGFNNVVYGAENIGEALGLKVKQIVVESEKDAPEKIVNEAREGIRLLIGDAISVKQALKLGMEGMLITSGRESIVRAIEAAKKIAEVRIRERERAELLRMIVDNSHDGIIAVDQNGQITLCNPVAEKIFGITAGEAVGANVEDKIPNTELPRVLRSEKPEFGELQYVGDKVIITRRFAIKVNDWAVGAIANFQDVTEVQRLEQIVRQKLHAKGLVAKTRLGDIVGDSLVIKELKERAQKFAAVDANLLIVGESGTGKEMLAQAIHNLSFRSSGPFVAINCAALPENLLESELFGYEEGAFTGAKKGGKPGMFELAHGGTILLDEIGEMPLKLQARLLRVLEEKEVLRVGGDRIIPVDVRTVAATNRNLVALVREGVFRDDLYYRLNILKLRMPSLRERKEDIPLLVECFLRKYQSLNKGIRKIDKQALTLIQEQEWGGNVRELKNVVQRLVILSENAVIGATETKQMIREMDLDRQTDILADKPVDNLAAMEMQKIAAVLAEENYNKGRAAKRLGIDRTTLWRKMQNDAKCNT